MSLSTGATLRLAEIAAAVGGTVRGDASAVVGALAPLDRATAGDLSFLASKKYAPQLVECGATAILVTPELADAPGQCTNRIVVAKPQEAMLALLPKFYRMPARPFVGVHPSAVVASDAVVDADACVEAFVVIGAKARIGKGCWIGAHTVVGEGATLGANSRLLPQVTLYPGVQIGERTVIHAGSRIGGDGFGYVFHNGAHQKIPHVGGCVIGNDVEIGSNVTIDRGSIGQTEIGDGTKIDNLVHVAHNVRIGKLCLLAALVGVAGSTRIGDRATFAGQSGVSGHLSIGSGVTITAQSGVVTDVPDGEMWGGFPSRPHKETLREYAALSRLPEFMRRVERLLFKKEEDGETK
jgi:UDP-3-O-[3-hydroxymyristoyl] glucosamine N-acyltransferase